MKEKLFDTLDMVYAPRRAVINGDHFPIYHMEAVNLGGMSFLTTCSLEGELNQKLGMGWFSLEQSSRTHIYLLEEGQKLQGEASWGSGWVVGFQPERGKVIQKIEGANGQQFIFENKGAFCLMASPSESLIFKFMTQPRIHLLAASGIWNSHSLGHIDPQIRSELDEFVNSQAPIFKNPNSSLVGKAS